MQIDMKRVGPEYNMDRFYLSNSHKVCLWIRRDVPRLLEAASALGLAER